jgi:hypothetical protein
MNESLFFYNDDDDIKDDTELMNIRKQIEEEKQLAKLRKQLEALKKKGRE